MGAIDTQGVLRRIEEGDAVYYHAANGVAGQTYPIGTAQMPVDNYTDLMAICSTRGANIIIVEGALTLGGATQEYNIIGLRRHHNSVNLNGESINGCHFEGLRIIGEVNWGDTYGPAFTDCDFDSVTAFSGFAYFCRVPNGETLALLANGTAYIHDTYFDDAVVDANGCARLDIWAGHGKLELTNVTGGVVNIFLDGELTLAASCTGGTINLHGDFELTDNSGGSTVDDHRSLKEAASTVGTATENWQAAEANIVQVGANDTLNKLHSLFISLHNLVGVITVRRYIQVNGVERQLNPDYVIDASVENPGIPIVDGTIGIHEVLRVTAQSDNAADNGQDIDYDYMLEAM